MKKCIRCLEVKEDSCFSKAKANADGLFKYCKECDKKRTEQYRNENRDKVEESQKKYREKNKEVIRKRIKEHYEKNSKEIYAKKRANRRLKVSCCSQEEYDKLLKIQNGKCAICGITEKEYGKQLSADHCHNSKEVRGLLCNNCNLVLGLAKDSFTILFKAMAYLKCPPVKDKE